MYWTIFRVWWGHKGRFIGFFSQHRPFVFPRNEESAGPATLPYDITEVKYFNIDSMNYGIFFFKT